jgi:hypothetical protein
MIFTGSALHPVQAQDRAVINIVSNARRGEALHGKLRASTPMEGTAAGSFPCDQFIIVFRIQHPV